VKQALALAGFLALALSPSFIDWQQEQNNGRRGQIVIYYVVALALIYAGLWGYDGS
jgi:hypothetical protein